MDGSNKVFRFFSWLLDILLLGGIWILCSLPVLTIVPASSALYYSCAKCLRFKESAPCRNFFSAFKQNLRTGLLVGLVFLPVTALVAYGLFFLYSGAVQAGGSWRTMFIVFTALALLPLAIMLSAVCMLSRFEYTAGGLLKDSVRVTVQNLPRLLCSALLTAGFFYLSARLRRIDVAVLVPGICAYLCTFLLEPVLRKYTPGYDPDDGVIPEEKPWYLR